MSTFITQIIIDNIQTKQTTDEIRQITTDVFKNKINKITQLKRGGLLVIPSHTEHIQHLTDPTNYPTELCVRIIYIHKTDNNRDKQPWLCINKVTYDKDKDEQTLNELRDKLNEQQDEGGNDIRIRGLHRKFRGPLPTTLILFKTNSTTGQNFLHNTDIDQQQRQLTARLYIQQTRQQCTNCHSLGHSTSTCTNNNICVRCGKDCPTNKCNSNYKKCINCDGPHSSNHTNCDKLRQHINKRYQQNTTLTYAQVPVLNKQHHKLDTTQQQQNTQLTEIQTTLNTLQQQTITEQTEHNDYNNQ